MRVPMSTRNVESRSLRYSLIVRWARHRYGNKLTGEVIISRGGVPSRYSIIENLAAVKLLGLSDHYGPRIR